MHRFCWIGKEEKHRLDVSVRWFLGIFEVTVDGKTLLRRFLLSKVDYNLEIGARERHLVRIRYYLWDSSGSPLKIIIDGQDSTRSLKSGEGVYRMETPVDDAAAALFFVSLVNLVFAVIGTLFVPYLDSLLVRLLLMLGAMIYLLLAVQILSGKVKAVWAAAAFFLADSIMSLYYEFSWGGLAVRAVIFYYLAMGLYYVRTHRKKFRGPEPA